MWRLVLVCVAFNFMQNADGECGYASCPALAPGQLNVHLVPHTHDDVGWLKTVDQYFYGSRNDIQRAGVQFILDSVVESLLKDPTRRFIYVESAFFWRWWGEQDEKMQDTVRNLVNEGRLEFIGGGWSMNDEAAAHYTAIIDNMALGIKFLQEEFGVCGRPRIGWQIDPFGHAREHAHIMAKIGFDGLFLGRIDHEDKARRLLEKEMEMVWHVGSGTTKEEIFTGAMYHTYSPPPGFCFDTLCEDVIMDDERLEDYNLDSKVEDFLKLAREQAASFATSNIMMTMGEDFNYQDANMWYKNLDKLIKYINSNSSQHGVYLVYSTPSCYLKAIHDSGVMLPTKDDDFFPYASDPHAYWTGYFTSRPTLKGMIRNANSQLQACKQIHSEADQEDPRLEAAKRAVAVNQHHDAVSGTAKQHVTDDYALRLHRGMEGCQGVMADGLGSGSGQLTCSFHEWCPLLNISQCAFTETRDKFLLVVYNPSPRNRTFYVRIPVVESKQYLIKDDLGNTLQSQTVPVPASVLSLPGRNSSARFELVVKVENVPGLDFRSINFAKIEAPEDASPLPHLSGKFRHSRLESRRGLKIDLDEANRIRRIRSEAGDISMYQEFAWYTPAVGNNSSPENRASGAYIFRPDGGNVVPAGKPTSAQIFKGDLVQEVHQVYGNWLSQVIRVYADEDIGELEWMVGPIPIDDGGKEVITRFSTDLNSGDRFWTDSNGRGLLERIRNKRETWDLNLTEPVSANYYPVNARMAISEENRGSLYLLTDRSQGGSSLQSGDLEVMLHRRLLWDDAFGVGEALNETAYGVGLVARGKLRFLLCEEDCEVSSGVEANSILNPPVLLFGEYCDNLRKERAAEPVNLPPSVNLLTKERWDNKTVLVRLENIGGSEESVPLESLFKSGAVASALEVTIDGGAPVGGIKRFQWHYETNDVTSTGTRDQVNSKESAEGQLTVAIQPGEIKSYLVTMQ